MFLHLLLSADEKGVVETTRRLASAQLRMNEAAWYRALKRLESEQRINIRANSQNTVISICKWTEYQEDRTAERTATRTTSETTSDTALLLYREDKKNKKNKNIHTSECSDFLAHFNSVTGKALTLTPYREKLILKRLSESYTLDQLKAAATNFSKDDWPDRYKFLDVQYCIGVIGGKDNLEKWLNLEVKNKSKVLEYTDPRGRVIQVKQEEV